MYNRNYYDEGFDRGERESDLRRDNNWDSRDDGWYTSRGGIMSDKYVDSDGEVYSMM